MESVLILGNLTIDDVVLADGTTYMGSLGGNTIHVACAAIVNGVKPILVARMGEDFELGVLSPLTARGADISHLTSIPGPTVRNWVIYEWDGSRTWLYRTKKERSLEVSPEPSDITPELLRDCRVVHICAMPLANAESLVAEVRKLSPSMFITLDTHEDWVAGYRERLVTLAKKVDVFLPSIEELEMLVGEMDPTKSIEILKGLGIKSAVIKANSDGAYVLECGATTHVEAPLVIAKDSTGAGDSFCGALIAALALGHNLIASAKIACETASLAIQDSGSLRLLSARSKGE